MSRYSFATTVVFYNLALLLVYLLRRKRGFLLRYGTQILLLITLLAVIRLFTPLDLKSAYILSSGTVLPAIEGVLKSSPAPAAPWLSVGRLLLIVWGLGTGVFAVKFAIRTVRATRSRRRYGPVEDQRVERAVAALGVKYPVTVSPQVSTPHTAGLFRPAVYLPVLELTEEEWACVLGHEVQHIRSHDVWIKLFYSGIQAVFWWNPVSHLFMRELDAMLELRCDASLTAGLDEREKLQYLSTLLAVAKQTAPAGSQKAAYAGFTGGDDLKQRFEAILPYGKAAGRKAKGALCALALLVFCLSYFVVIQPAYAPPEEDLIGMIDVTEDNAFILFDGQNYWLYGDGRLLDRLDDKELQADQYNTLPIYDGSPTLSPVPGS
ncbi:MAG: M56 family metallopeptidase [Oscillospiraceae bacterium]